MFIVVYRPHNELNLATQYFGPFHSWNDADDMLGELPALGVHIPVESGPCGPGCKFIQELITPKG